MFANPVRSQARPSTLLSMLVRPSQAGAVTRDAEIVAECRYQQDLSKYKAEQDKVKFDQTTLDMQ